MRLGIALRLLGVLLLGSLVVVEGGAMKNRAFEGKTEHYTVVLAANADANAVAKQDAKRGVKVEHVVSNDTYKAYVASMPTKQANTVEHESSVSYIEMDSQKTVHHTWWDSTLITLGLQPSRLS